MRSYLDVYASGADPHAAWAKIREVVDRVADAARETPTAVTFGQRPDGAVTTTLGVCTPGQLIIVDDFTLLEARTLANLAHLARPPHIPSPLFDAALRED